MATYMIGEMLFTTEVRCFIQDSDLIQSQAPMLVMRHISKFPSSLYFSS